VLAHAIAATLTNDVHASVIVTEENRSAPCNKVDICSRRFYECWRHSWMLGYHSVVYYLAVAVIEMVGLDTFLQQWKRPVMAAIAVLTGAGCSLSMRLFSAMSRSDVSSAISGVPSCHAGPFSAPQLGGSKTMQCTAGCICESSPAQQQHSKGIKQHVHSSSRADKSLNAMTGLTQASHCLQS